MQYPHPPVDEAVLPPNAGLGHVTAPLHPEVLVDYASAFPLQPLLVSSSLLQRFPLKQVLHALLEVHGYVLPGA